MKIGIQTWGSFGDIGPFVALADGLQSDGHDVTLVITSVDSALDDILNSQTGVKVKMVSSPVINDLDIFTNIEGTIFDESDPIKQTQIIIEKLFLPAEASMYEAAVQLCAENDLVIGHFFHYPLNVSAELSGCDYVSVALVHSAIPSIFQPPAGIPNLGTLSNRFAWWLVKLALNKKLKKYSDHLRSTYGIKPAHDLMEDVWASKQLTLLAISPQICSRKADWPEHYQVCGFMNSQVSLIKEDISYELQIFLSKGDTPIYMTFGSAIFGGNLKETISILRDAAKKASVRAIIQVPKWQKYGFKSDDIFHYIDSAPHSEIFPLCSAIVHHGGAGTSQSTLLAGKPSVVVAHTSEQDFWGKELARLNVSSKPLVRRKLTADNLAENIIYVIESNAVNEKARKIAEDMSKENGVATAIELIDEKFMA